MAVARTFGEGFGITGAQDWDDDIHVFGDDPFFNGLVNFADNQVFPTGTSFVTGQDISTQTEDYYIWFWYGLCRRGNFWKSQNLR